CSSVLDLDAVQERGRLPEIWRVEAFREPARRRAEQLRSLGAPLASCDQASEARRRPELERPRLPPARDVDRSAEALLGLVATLRRTDPAAGSAPEEQLPLQPVQLRLEVPFPVAFHGIERAVQLAKCITHQADASVAVRSEGAIGGLVRSRADTAVAFDAAAQKLGGLRPGT